MKKLLLYPVLLLLVVACSKDDSPETDETTPEKKCRLVKIIQGTHNGAVFDTTFLFRYDDAGKLIMVSRQQAPPSYSYDLKLSYDDAGRLTKISSPHDSTVIFRYTTNGLLLERTELKQDTFRFTFEYGSASLPQKCIRSSYSSYNKTWNTSEYRYSWQNGNMISREFYRNGALDFTSTYEYDTLPNVGAAQALINVRNLVPIGWEEEFLYFNKNLLKKAISKPNGISITYKVDSGKVTQSVYDWFSEPTYTDLWWRETRNYFYECSQ